MFLGMAATADASTEAPSKLDTLDTDFDKLVNKILNDETKTFLLNNVLKDISDNDKPNVIKRLLKAKVTRTFARRSRSLLFCLATTKKHCEYEWIQCVRRLTLKKRTKQTG